MNNKNLIYAVTCVLFTIILGAGIYEHIAVWPQAFAAPPRSLAMFQGAYHLNATPFWKSIHPIVMISFIATLLVNWKTERRKWIAIPLAAYVVVLIVTFAFFVPELMSLTSTAFSDTVDPELQARGSRWITLSLIRAGILALAMVTLCYGLTKSAFSRK